MNDALLESVQKLISDIDPPWLTFNRRASHEDGLPYRSYEEHCSIRNAMRWYANNHPYAAAALEIRVSYVVGSGHNYRVVPKPGQAVSSELIGVAHDVIYDFMDRNRWIEKQKEMQYRMDRDGEVFLHLFEQDRELAVRFIDPELIKPPPNAPKYDDYGIRVHPQDNDTVLGYWVWHPSQHAPDSFIFVDASQIQHRKANVVEMAPRGLPVLWPCRESLRRSHQILRSMSTVAAIQASVAAVVRRTLGTTVVPFVKPGDPGTIQDEKGRTIYQLPPGSIIHLAPGEEWDAPVNRIDVSNYVAAIQAELRAIAARLCIPEYMLSADASNANYASTMVAEGPAVKIFERIQSEMIWYDTEILNRVLKLAERKGVLPHGFHRQIRVEAEAPLVMSRNRLMEAQADQILLSMGIVSRQTVAARHGYDWALEKERIETEGGPAGIPEPPPSLLDGVP